MAEGEDKDSKTEQPTQKRIEDAVKRGQVAQSREVGHFLILLVLTIFIGAMLPGISKNGMQLLAPLLERADNFPVDGHGLKTMLQELTLRSVLLIIAPLLFVCVAAIGANLMQSGFHISTEPIMPKLEKISIRKGFKRIFSFRSIVELIKGIIKISIVGIIAFNIVNGQIAHLHQLPNDDSHAMLAFLLKMAVKLMIGVCIAVFFIALLDFMYQRFEYMKSLRMSKQELKDEYKQQEGDPHIKGKLREIRMQRAQKRMMAAVPTSDVVITNPTHFAVALQYENGKMAAPKVVAKGQDFIALQIRKIAAENEVPIVENPPLARALYDSVDIDEEIPVTHYQAVAEIISYVYKLKGKMMR